MRDWLPARDRPPGVLILLVGFSALGLTELRAQGGQPLGESAREVVGCYRFVERPFQAPDTVRLTDTRHTEGLAEGRLIAQPGWPPGRSWAYWVPEARGDSLRVTWTTGFIWRTMYLVSVGDTLLGRMESGTDEIEPGATDPGGPARLVRTVCTEGSPAGVKEGTVDD